MSDRTIDSTVADFVSEQLEVCGKTQFEVAPACGLERPQMISMIKNGRSRIPRDRIKDMARALNVDPLTFGVKVMREYYPELLWIVEGCVKQALQEPAKSCEGSFRLQPATH